MFKKVRAVEILLVEDSRGDVELICEALEGIGVDNRVEVVTNGEDALRFLNQALEGRHLLADLIFLDLNLPKMDGRELLGRIKSSSALRHIPVIVMTTSQAPSDVAMAYDLHANSFVSKPMRADDFVAKVREIVDYWMTVVTLPDSGQKLDA